MAAPDAPFLCSAEEQPGNIESKHLGQQHLVITHLNEGGRGVQVQAVRRGSLGWEAAERERRALLRPTLMSRVESLGRMGCPVKEEQNLSTPSFYRKRH